MRAESTGYPYMVPMPMPTPVLSPQAEQVREILKDISNAFHFYIILIYFNKSLIRVIRVI